MVHRFNMVPFYDSKLMLVPVLALLVIWAVQVHICSLILSIELSQVGRAGAIHALVRFWMNFAWTPTPTRLQVVESRPDTVTSRDARC
jgi:hypothetical protein